MHARFIISIASLITSVVGAPILTAPSSEVYTLLALRDTHAQAIAATLEDFKREILQQSDASVPRSSSTEDAIDTGDVKGLLSTGPIDTSLGPANDEPNSSTKLSRNQDISVTRIEQRKSRNQNVWSSWQKRDPRDQNVGASWQKRDPRDQNVGASWQKRDSYIERSTVIEDGE
ncbi:hypothetical protein GRF29_213g711795 [Pseudopithomyces chartarum]|uniref:Uncharacterized protein n=1 Tax=Pseudopithomyces chartarum TaxID=1892770 RepID=A0AAN6LS36_9PLEO|nr:hypothetical protein GRF29_213g711795 [Pseudopithomyces chartarum]